MTLDEPTTQAATTTHTTPNAQLPATPVTDDAHIEGEEETAYRTNYGRTTISLNPPSGANFQTPHYTDHKVSSIKSAFHKEMHHKTDLIRRHKVMVGPRNRPCPQPAFMNTSVWAQHQNSLNRPLGGSSWNTFYEHSAVTSFCGPMSSKEQKRLTPYPNRLR
jgi:hypothetical protein